VIVLEQSTLMDFLLSFMLVSVRISTMMLVAPLFSATAITVPIRVAVTMVLAIVMVSVMETPKLDPMSATGIALLVQEALIGATIGFVMQLAFAAVSLAGEMISTSMGLSFASMVDPQSGTQSPVVTQILAVMMLLAFMALEGHHILLKQLAASYEVLPIGGPFLNPAMFIAILKAGSLVFSAAFLISLPIVVALFLINITIGMLTRVAPQMNIFAIGFPITIFAGIVLTMVTMPTIANGMAGLLDEVARLLREIILTGVGG
jgi:flagellar biosynthetic protein FliR